MTITNEQRELLTVIMENKDNLEQLLKLVSVQKKQAKDLQMKESITIAGITWSKFAEDAEGNAYMLADESIGDMKFGENNDWKESLIRKRLNSEMYQKIADDFESDVLATIQVDLFSHDGLRDYGKCEDMVSLLTYDLYRNNRENIKDFDKWYWTCTPNSTPSGCGSGCVRYVGSGGYVGCGGCCWNGGVRPFFILKSSIFVSCNSVTDSQ